MGKIKERIQPAVRKETEHVMVYTAVGVAAMWCVFLILHLVLPRKVPFDYTVILGGLFALLAFVIYLLAIRDAVDHIRSQAETVYEVARAAQTGYEWLTEKVTLFLRLREEFRSK